MKKYISLNFNSEIPSDHKEIKSTLKNFACGEWEFSIQEDVSSQEVIIFQGFTIGKFDSNLLQLIMVCNVLKHNHVKRITLYAPFLPYTRQDRAYEVSCSLGSKIVADLINLCKIDELITYDLHAPQIEGFFQCKVKNLSVVPQFIEHIKNNFNTQDVVVVFPDVGSMSRCKRFFTDETFEIIMLRKNRAENNIKMKILGSVKDKIAIIIDDMIDSGGTLIEAVNTVKQHGATAVNAYATHGILSGSAVEKINNSILNSAVVSNSIAPLKIDYGKIFYLPI